MTAHNTDGTTLSSDFVSFVNMNDGNYFLEILNNAANIKRISIKACILTDCKEIFFNVKVCGREVLSTASLTAQNFVIKYSEGDETAIAAMNDTTRYFSLPEATFKDYFVISPVIETCTVNNYETLGYTLANSVSMTGSLGSYILKVDRTLATT